MSAEKQQNFAETQPVSASGTELPPQEEFLSLRDILAMILRHRWAILLFVLLSTLAAGIFFITRPQQYKAEGYLQVIYPVSPEGRVDKELFENIIASHLQKASSAYIAMNVAAQLSKQGFQTTPFELEKQVKITRPAKTDLICLVGEATSTDKALLIMRLWIREYLTSIQKNNIYAALFQARSLLKQSQCSLMEKQATANHMREQVAKSSPLITLSRSVDDRQLLSELSQKAAPDPEAFKKMSEIHILSQEQSKEYIDLKKAMLETEQKLSEVLGRRNLYQEVVRLLEKKIALNGAYQEDTAALTNASLSEPELYINILMKNSEIVQYGEPGLILSARGALKKTGLFFLMSLGLACLCAFIYEWGKGLLSSR
ncbi:MAG: Wzz/FepE/Etk N-terminal domain-containing protein [Kiritimatiellae bacterium]|nr:Wzz/FepE/Etk N-terminal domain-containing protein [Kiritimatiellia bacterium]